MKYNKHYGLSVVNLAWHFWYVISSLKGEKAYQPMVYICPWNNFGAVVFSNTDADICWSLYTDKMEGYNYMDGKTVNYWQYFLENVIYKCFFTRNDSIQSTCKDQTTDYLYLSLLTNVTHQQPNKKKEKRQAALPTLVLHMFILYFNAHNLAPLSTCTHGYQRVSITIWH